VAQAVPSWVAPSEQQLTDCARLTTHQAGDYSAGVAAALAWVRDAGPAPLTRGPGPATAQAAEEEFFVAGKVELEESPLSAVVSPVTAQAVGRTLSWLLGWERRPPVELPRRPVPSAEQLYGEAVAAEPWRFRLPEQQAAGRLAAQQEAMRLRRLAAQADQA
jgi:hypothetical protein